MPIPAKYSLVIYGHLSEDWGYRFSGINIFFAKQADDIDMTHMTIELANGAALVET